MYRHLSGGLKEELAFFLYYRLRRRQSGLAHLNLPLSGPGIKSLKPTIVLDGSNTAHLTVIPSQVDDSSQTCHDRGAAYTLAQEAPIY